MSDPIRILMGSDFHFGIPTMDQRDMADAYAKTIFPLLAETDIFFINGDFFDTLVNFNHHGFDPIYDTIMNTFALCEHHKIKLRVLQGTFTHDRDQLKRLVNFYTNRKFTFDFYFASGIDLEEITVRDRTLRVAYVPDDLPFKSSDDIVDVIKVKMNELGWETIDYACMHGFFDFTFPKGIKQDNVVVFKESQFDFVTKMVDVGHVHQNRTSGKVISNGSFDRMVYGDEDPKGLIKVFDYADHYTAQFVENTYAEVFDTIAFTKDDTTETICERITKHLSSLTTKRRIHLRCLIEVAEHGSAIKEWMRTAYPDVACKVKVVSDGDEKPLIPQSALFVAVEKRVAPTPKTIASFIRAHITDDYPLTIDQIDEYLELAAAR